MRQLQVSTNQAEGMDTSEFHKRIHSTEEARPFEMKQGSHSPEAETVQMHNGARGELKRMPRLEDQPTAITPVFAARTGDI